MTSGTPAERREQRAAKRTANRTQFFVARIRESRNGREQLQHACAFARAVGDDLPDPERQEMARLIVALTDERNQPK